jgi:hypothetical protein
VALLPYQELCGAAGVSAVLLGFARLEMLRFGLVALMLTMALPALAQGRGSQEDQQACEPDVYRLCNDYVPDVDRIVACLNARKRYLAPACRAVMARPHARPSGR